MRISGIEPSSGYRGMVILDFICIDPLSYWEQAGIEKFKIKVYVSSGIRTHA